MAQHRQRNLSYPRYCAWKECGQLFEPTRYDARFHSDACRVAHNRWLKSYKESEHRAGQAIKELAAFRNTENNTPSFKALERLAAEIKYEMSRYETQPELWDITKKDGE